MATRGHFGMLTLGVVLWRYVDPRDGGAACGGTGGDDRDRASAG